MKVTAMTAMIGFMKTSLSMPKGWLIWLMALFLTNLVGAMVYIHTLEGQIVLGGMVVGMVILTAIFGQLGWVRLLGLGHVYWVPMVPWLWSRLGSDGSGSAFEWWLMAVIVMDSLSLIIDITEVTRYLLGDRTPTLPPPG